MTKDVAGDAFQLSRFERELGLRRDESECSEQQGQQELGEEMSPGLRNLNPE